MKLEDKILWPFVIFVVCFVIIELIFFNFFYSTKETYEQIVNEDTRFNNHENLIIYYDLMRESAFLNYRQSKEEEYLNRYNKYLQKTRDLYESIIKEISNNEINENYKDKFNIYGQIIYIEQAIIKNELNEDYINSDEYLELKELYDSKKDLPKEYFQLRIKENVVNNIKNSKVYLSLMIAIICVFIILILTEFVIVKRDVINPMTQITKGLDNIRSKKFKKINIKTTTEMGDVIGKLNETSIRLHHFQKNVGKQITDKNKTNKQLNTQVSTLSGEISNLKHMVELAMVTMKSKKPSKNNIKEKVKMLEEENKYLQNMVKLANVVNKKLKEEEK